MNIGVGETELNTMLTGKNKINAGVGNLKINLQDGKENYSIKIHKGIGNIRINGEKAFNGQLYDNGSNIVDIHGGVGNIEINF